MRKNHFISIYRECVQSYPHCRNHFKLCEPHLWLSHDITDDAVCSFSKTGTVVFSAAKLVRNVIVTPAD